MHPIIKLYSQDIDQVKLIAASVAKTLKIGDVVALKGELGSGKTKFSEFMINAILLSDTKITSPTFNIVNLYNVNSRFPSEPDFNIWHFDLYRLKEKSEIHQLGIEDAFNTGISIIEWPEIIKDILPANTIYIELLFSHNSIYRDIYIENFEYNL
jgi:tRNA threonylcarbamoyl adenosine modification protein YjeE